jgi:multiple sugar transport system substrate-binding protein
MDRREFLKLAGVTAAFAGTWRLPSLLGRKSDLEPDASVTGHVTLAFYGAADIIKAWDVIFTDFSKVYPNVKVDAVPIAASTWSTYADAAILQMAGGREFDILQGAINIQRLLITKGVVSPLDEFIERDKAQLAPYFADENPKFLAWNKSLISKGGPTYYLPADYNTYCCWVNTEMFEKAGVPVPSDGWTWDDLMAAGEKICTSPGTYLMHCDPGDMFFFQPWALTNGGTLLSADWSKSTLASPQTIEAAAFAQSLCLKGYSPKPGGAFDDVVEFVDNKLAIFGCGMWLNPGIVAAKAAGKVKIVAWPQKVQKGTSVGWNAYPITKSSKNKEAAWAFIKYVASTRAVVNLTSTGQATPGRKSVFYADLHKAAPEKGIDEFWTEVNYATPVPSPDASDAVNAAIIKTVTQLYSSNANPKTLMTALDTQVSGYLNNSGPGGVS